MRQKLPAAKPVSTLIRVVFTFVLLLASAKADVFTFLDATDYGGPVSVVSTNPARLMITTNISGLSWILLAPSPTAVFVSDNCPLGQIGCLHINVGEYPINPNVSLDFRSDRFQFAFIDQYVGNLLIEPLFPREDGDANCALGCNVREDGKVYTLDTVTWSDGTVDTIKFQSTPEPTSLILLASILVALCSVLRGTAQTTH